jgi:dihydroneopterin aldolase
MQVTSYGKLSEKVEKLNQTEQLRLLEQIAVLIRSKVTAKTRHSIQKYVDKERALWNGQA